MSRQFPGDVALVNMGGRSPLARLADFLFEAGMLARTPRSGFQFLGSGGESVAAHSYRAALIGYALAKRAGCNAEHTAMLCLIHDFHEARTGDFNYVNSMYNSSDNLAAMEHAAAGTGLEKDLLPLWEEQEAEQTPEARLAADADQLDLIFSLAEQRSLGNRYADKWLESAVRRVRTEEGRALMAAVLDVDPTDWWFKGPDHEWWVNKGK